jgi:hypothetical protein
MEGIKAYVNKQAYKHTYICTLLQFGNQMFHEVCCLSNNKDYVSQLSHFTGLHFSFICLVLSSFHYKKENTSHFTSLTRLLLSKSVYYMCVVVDLLRFSAYCYVTMNKYNNPFPPTMPQCATPNIYISQQCSRTRIMPKHCLDTRIHQSTQKNIAATKDRSTHSLFV